MRHRTEAKEGRMKEIFMKRVGVTKRPRASENLELSFARGNVRRAM